MSGVNIKPGGPGGIGPKPAGASVDAGGKVGPGGGRPEQTGQPGTKPNSKPTGPDGNGPANPLPRSQGNGPKSSRVGELAAQTQQIADKIKNSPGPKPDLPPNQNISPPPQLNRLAPEPRPNADGHQPGGNAYGRQNNGPAQNLQLNGNQAKTKDGGTSAQPARNLQLNGNANGQEARLRGTGADLSRGEARPVSAVVEYLRGTGDGRDLPPAARNALDAVANVLGREAVNELVNQRPEKIEKFVDHLLRQAERQAADRQSSTPSAKSVEYSRSFVDEKGHQSDVARAASEQYSRSLVGQRELPPDVPRDLDVVTNLLGSDVVNELLGQPDKKIEKTIDRLLRQAEAPLGDRKETALPAAAVEYLRGDLDGGDLPPEVRRALDVVTGLLGRETIDELVLRRGEKIEKFIGYVLRQVSQLPNDPEQPIHEPGRLLQQTIDELANAIQLSKYFAQQEKIGGDAVRRAEEAVLRLLARQLEGNGQRRLYPAELLRDLRSGTFLPAQEAYSPFPLTGRARVISEMMELMRTLDAIERIVQQLKSQSAPGAIGGQEAETLARLMTGGVEGELEGLLSLLPTLPGRAGRSEIARLIAALNGMLVDAEGKMLLTKDGTPLKLDQLLWLSTAGGLLGSAFKADSFPTRLSPLIIYGFDAIYSLIGFDGRTLTPPHFAAVQAQINGSELEWVFGQPPLTDGWMRALIERLKDSASPDHNLLGEMLEEALANGHFHAVLLRGSVEEGEPVRGSFSVARLLPGPSADHAFAPA